MRKSNNNTIDNMMRKMNIKMQDQINRTMAYNDDMEDKVSSKFRDGYLRFGAFQMFNNKNANNCYATFGYSNCGNNRVGP